MSDDPDRIIDKVLRLFSERGDSSYGGEAVTQREHALQAAHFARQSGATSALVVAALLHDIGHLLHHLPDDAPDHGVDDRHEQLGATWLSHWFGPQVSEPVRLHVAAKRYLCAAELEYSRQLSGPSLISLQLQGGPMSAEEMDMFRASSYFAGAVSLRRWDEAAKVPEMRVAAIEEYVTNMRAALTAAPATQGPT